MRRSFLPVGWIVATLSACLLAWSAVGHVANRVTDHTSIVGDSSIRVRAPAFPVLPRRRSRRPQPGAHRCRGRGRCVLRHAGVGPDGIRHPRRRRLDRRGQCERGKRWEFRNRFEELRCERVGFQGLGFDGEVHDDHDHHPARPDPAATTTAATAGPHDDDHIATSSVELDGHRDRWLGHCIVCVADSDPDQRDSRERIRRERLERPPAAGRLHLRLTPLDRGGRVRGNALSTGARARNRPGSQRRPGDTKLQA